MWSPGEPATAGGGDGGPAFLRPAPGCVGGPCVTTQPVLEIPCPAAPPSRWPVRRRPRFRLCCPACLKSSEASAQQPGLCGLNLQGPVYLRSCMGFPQDKEQLSAWSLLPSGPNVREAESPIQMTALPCPRYSYGWRKIPTFPSPDCIPKHPLNIIITNSHFPCCISN